MFDSFLNNKKSWLKNSGPDCEIVFSSRVRLARNLADYNFPGRASYAQRERVLSEVMSACRENSGAEEMIFARLEELSELDRHFLLERHLVSQEHILPFDEGAKPSLKGKGVVISGDERLSIMINEEDHIRAQYITSGFDLERCFKNINEFDDSLSREVTYAFLPEFGHLTACPTNVGTGLRASCMLHLPALVFTKRINKVLELLAKISFTARGFFGEGTQALGNFFQISNQVSLGVSESEIIGNLNGVVNQVKEQELDARETLMVRHKLSLEDSVWRAMGILQNSRLINTQEVFNHLSMLSLGLDLGIINGIKRELINSLFVIIQPAHLQKIENKQLNEIERDRVRAQILREKIKPKGGKDVQ